MAKATSNSREERCLKGCCLEHVTKRVTMIFLVALHASFFDPCIAVDYTVGGAAGFWDIPSVSKINYTMWALWNNYFVGDTLYFRYEKGDHSVLEVTFKDYQYCRNARPIASYADGNSRIVLDRYGPYYFICGFPDHCYLGQKFDIDVVDLDRESSPPTIPTLSTRQRPRPVEIPASAPARDANMTSVAPNPGISAALKRTSSLIVLLALTSFAAFISGPC